MIYLLLGIFVGETLLNVIQARYVRAVGQGHSGRSALLSGLSSLGTFALWSLILTHPEELGIHGGLALALGSTVGTFYGARRV